MRAIRFFRTAHSHTAQRTGAATVRTPGSCGELVQGLLDGAYFHVTCPVDLYSTVTVSIYEGEEEVLGPEDCPKTIQVVRLALGQIGVAGAGATVRVSSSIPRGKGMASSTADVASAIAAVFIASGLEPTPQTISRIALQVEPTDGIMFPGIVLFDHRDGTRLEYLGRAPAIELVAADFGGTLDTLEFNRTERRAVLVGVKAQIEEALAMARPE